MESTSNVFTAAGLGVLQLRVDGAQERGKIYYLITVQERATKFVI